MPKIPDTLTVAQAAARLGTTVQTIRNRIRDGALPADTTREPWLVRVADLGLVQVRKAGRPRKQVTCPHCHQAFAP